MPKIPPVPEIPTGLERARTALGVFERDGVGSRGWKWLKRIGKVRAGLDGLERARVKFEQAGKASSWLERAQAAWEGLERIEAGSRRLGRA